MKPLADVTPFPASPVVVWRREFAECHTFPEALALSYKLILEVERLTVAGPTALSGGVHAPCRSLALPDPPAPEILRS